MLETFRDILTVRATVGKAVVALLQHPVETATDWRVYLKSENPAEEKRREAIRRKLAIFTAEDEAFMSEYRAIGCEVDITLGDINLFPHE